MAAGDTNVCLGPSTMQNGGMIVAVQTTNGQTTAVRQILHRQRDHERGLAVTA